MISEDLQKKIDQSVKLLQSVGARTEGPIEIAYSGGKDSDVILQLAKEAGISYRAIYKNTTIDPPGTIKHVQAGGGGDYTPQADVFPARRKERVSQQANALLLRGTERIQGARQGSRRSAQIREHPTKGQIYRADTMQILRAHQDPQEPRGANIPDTRLDGRGRAEFCHGPEAGSCSRLLHGRRNNRRNTTAGVHVLSANVRQEAH